MDTCMLAGVDVDGSIIAMAAVVGGVLITLVAIFTGLIKGTAETKERERTKREIAAYVAEGSISPADAKELIASGQRPWHADRES